VRHIERSRVAAVDARPNFAERSSQPRREPEVGVETPFRTRGGCVRPGHAQVNQLLRTRRRLPRQPDVWGPGNHLADSAPSPPTHTLPHADFAGHTPRAWVASAWAWTEGVWPRDPSRPGWTGRSDRAGV